MECPSSNVRVTAVSRRTTNPSSSSFPISHLARRNHRHINERNASSTSARTSLFISGGAGFPSSSLVDASVAAVVSPPVDRRTMRVVWARLPVTRPVVVVDATRVVARRVVVGISSMRRSVRKRCTIYHRVFVHVEIT